MLIPSKPKITWNVIYGQAKHKNSQIKSLCTHIPTLTLKSNHYVHTSPPSLSNQIITYTHPHPHSQIKSLRTHIPTLSWKVIIFSSHPDTRPHPTPHAPPSLPLSPLPILKGKRFILLKLLIVHSRKPLVMSSNWEISSNRVAVPTTTQ